MNRQEAGKILKVITVAYPNYLSFDDEDALNERLELWATLFADFDYSVVIGAVQSVIVKSKFPPTIAEIMDKVRLFTQPKAMSESEAWKLVQKAVSNSLYNSEAEFKKLPENIQAIVCAPEQLKAWARLDEDEFSTVIASNFKRAYRAESDRQSEIEALPPFVRKNLESGMYLDA